MRARLSQIADRLSKSFWFVPATMTTAAVLLSALTLWADSLVDADTQPAWLQTLVYSGGTDGAREVLGTVASSMITVAGVVFSITIVVLTLASGQFGPRLLANFMKDRGNQVTLGTFISTFLYSLLVLRTIRSGEDEPVPHISVAVSLLLAIAGLSVLIYFIHHISITIQAPNLVASIGREVRSRVDHLFPEDAVLEKGGTERRPPELPAEHEGRRVDATSNGYVEVIDLDGLLETANRHDLLIRIDARPGSFVVRGTRFASAWPADRVTDKVVHTIASSAVTGPARTAIQDIEFPIEQLVEIAVRALSPSINDPFTASSCVDQLGAGLCYLATRELPASSVADKHGTPRLVVADPVTFDQLVDAAFGQIRQAADFHATVYVHLLDALLRIVGMVRSTDRLAALEHQARLVIERSDQAVPADADRDVVRQRYDDVVRAAGAR